MATIEIDVDELSRVISQNPVFKDTIKQTIWDEVHPQVEDLEVFEQLTNEADELEPGDKQDELYDQIDKQIDTICNKVCMKLYERMGL